MGIHTDIDQPLGISVPPGTILGYRADGRPIHVIAGGAETDEEPDGEAPDEEPEPDEDVDPEPKPKPGAPKPAEPKPTDEEYVPPSREEWERVRRTMAARKQEKLDVQRQLNELRDKYKDQETETEKAVRAAEEKAEARYKPIAVRKAVRSALVEAGGTAATDGDKEKNHGGGDRSDGRRQGEDRGAYRPTDEADRRWRPEHRRRRRSPRCRRADRRPARRLPGTLRACREEGEGAADGCAEVCRPGEAEVDGGKACREDPWPGLTLEGIFIAR